MNDCIVLSAEALDGIGGDDLSYIAERNPVAAERARVAMLAALDTLARTAPRVEGRLVELEPGVDCRRHFVHPVAIF